MVTAILTSEDVAAPPYKDEDQNKNNKPSNKKDVSGHIDVAVSSKSSSKGIDKQYLGLSAPAPVR